MSVVLDESAKPEPTLRRAAPEGSPAAGGDPAVTDTTPGEAQGGRPPRADAPVKPRRRHVARVVGWTLAVVFAFAGGMLATVLYDRWVQMPQKAETVVEDAPPAPPAPVTEPPPNPAVVRAEAVKKAVATSRAQLSKVAIAEVEARTDGGVVFLTGVVDGPDTMNRIARAIGEVEGILAVDVRGLKFEGRVHVMREGELLSDVARLYLGNGRAWPKLVKANPGIDPERVRPGQVLRIPSL